MLKVISSGDLYDRKQITLTQMGLKVRREAEYCFLFMSRKLRKKQENTEHTWKISRYHEGCGEGGGGWGGGKTITRFSIIKFAFLRLHKVSG